MIGHRMANERRGNRKALLVYLKPEIIRDLKMQSAAEDEYVYLLVEKALIKAGFGEVAVREEQP